MPDEIGLDWMVDLEKPNFNGRHAIRQAREKETLQHVLVGLEIEGNVPAELSLVYHRKKKEAGIVTAAIWSPLAKRNIAIASLQRPMAPGSPTISGWKSMRLRELQYQKMMKRAKIVPRPFIKLERRTATPPALF